MFILWDRCFNKGVLIGRNYIFEYKQIKDATLKLKQYEEKLKLYEKSKKINKLLEQIKDEKIKKEIKELI